MDDVYLRMRAELQGMLAQFSLEHHGARTAEDAMRQADLMLSAFEHIVVSISDRPIPYEPSEN